MDESIICFLTWTTYGTWLPGDVRGWIDKREARIQNGRYGLEQSCRKNLTEPPCRLSVDQREIVEETIKEHCQFRGWNLMAVNCRSNHVHVVVECATHPDKAMQEFKQWCTRRLKKDASKNVNQRERTKWWTKSGCVRYINDEEQLNNVLLYVISG